MAITIKDALIERYLETHKRSQLFHQRALRHFAGDGATHALRIFSPYRPYIVRAEGSRKWDVDGNEYIDYVMGHGALLLGHSHPSVVEAVRKQMLKGVLFGENHELEIEWADLIKEMIPSADKVEFCTSGQEANMLALRLARLFTGRRKILRLKYHYHGWLDELAMEESAGGVADEVCVLPANDAGLLEETLSSREYAALLLEGGGAVMSGRVPLDLDYVRSLPRITARHGTLLILDEVVTGFRESPGGWQSEVGILPDLTTLGKCLAGGLPIGAVIGRADIMEAFNPRIPADRLMVHGGTWNANSLVCAAGIAACNLYKTGVPQKKARDVAGLFRRQGNKALKEKQIPGRFYSRSIVQLYLGPSDFETDDDAAPPTKNPEKLLNLSMKSAKLRLCLHLLQRGIATKDGSMFTLSAAHTEIEIQRTVEALADSLGAMIDEGSL